jgi:hypothetical protein
MRWRLAHPHRRLRATSAIATKGRRITQPAVGEVGVGGSPEEGMTSRAAPLRLVGNVRA